jgi:hypothetical protein
MDFLQPKVIRDQGRVEPAKSNVMLAKYQHQASPKTLQPNKFQSTMQFHLRVLFILYKAMNG